MQVDTNLPQLEQNIDRQKRGADAAFGRATSPDLLQYSDAPIFEPMTQTGGIQDISTRMMAQMLGLDIPSIDPSASYYPGYEWWPRASTASLQPYLQPSVVGDHGQASFPNVGYPVNEANQNWASIPSYHYDFESSFSGRS